MRGRDLGGLLFLGATLLPKWAYGWIWETIRSQIEEKALHWLEEHVSGALLLDLSDYWRAIPIALVVWLFWPRIQERVPFLAPRFLPFEDAVQRLYEADEKASTEWSQ